MSKSGLDQPQIDRLERDATKHSIAQIAPGNMISRPQLPSDDYFKNIISQLAPGVLIPNKEKRVDILKDNLIHFFGKTPYDSRGGQPKDAVLANHLNTFVHSKGSDITGGREYSESERRQIFQSPRLEGYLQIAINNFIY